MLLVRWAGVAMAASSFMLGGWMVLSPNGFWSSVGVAAAGSGTGIDVTVRVVYGAAILGEGVALALLGWRPLRYLPFLHYMLAYKALAVVALTVRLVGLDPVPWGGWRVIGGWAVAGLIAAWAYPWGRWDEVVTALADEVAARRSVGSPGGGAASGDRGRAG